MMIQKNLGAVIKLTSENGYIHKVGTDIYAKSIIMLAWDTLDMYEEVSEIPKYTKDEYDAKVAELVRGRYTESEEFAIQRKAINASFSPSVTSAETALSEYAEYNAFVEECKIQAKEILSDKQKEDI